MLNISLADHIIHGTVTTVEQALLTGANVNEIDEYGFTPLIETAIVDNIDMAKLLLKHGAEVNGEDLTGRTALQWAVDNNNLEFCALLLQHHANPNHYTNAGQSALTYPLLRNQVTLKRLLYQHGANLDFAHDFINSKLLGHRFELLGYTDIIDAKGKFIPLDYEGFFLEFTVNTILHSLMYYRRSFINKQARAFALELEQMVDAFKIAAELIKYQHYLVNIAKHAKKIDALLTQDLLLLPVANEGHAISFIKYGHFFAKCDRGANSKREGSIVIYRVHNHARFNSRFLKQFMYEVHTRDYMQQGINEELGLETIMTLPLPAQIIGNCSWANIEAAIPTLLFLLLLQQAKAATDLVQLQDKALSFYKQWLRWDQDRALDECIQSFYQANPARKATKAAILADILFQKCRYTEAIDLERARKILRILNEPQYRYILKSYLNIYTKNKHDKMGANLRQLLDHFGVTL